MGYHEYLFQENELMTACVELTLKLGYPSNAVKPGNKIPEVEPLRMKFSASTVFPPSEDLFYPVES